MVKAIPISVEVGRRERRRRKGGSYSDPRTSGWRTWEPLAAFFAMVPGAMALERGSEANAPLARAILGGLMAGGPGTLFVLPCLYKLMVKDKPGRTDPQPSCTPGP